MEALRKAVSEAVYQALNEMGLEQFKKTSFFMSNDRTAAEQVEKQAA